MKKFYDVQSLCFTIMISIFILLMIFIGREQMIIINSAMGIASLLFFIIMLAISICTKKIIEPVFGIQVFFSGILVAIFAFGFPKPYIIALSLFPSIITLIMTKAMSEYQLNEILKSLLLAFGVPFVGFHLISFIFS